MAGDIYPRFRATAVQQAPVFLDREATISRLADWVAKARDVGADLVVFGDSFIPAFPLWNMLCAPVDQHAFYRRLFENAVEITLLQTGLQRLFPFRTQNVAGGRESNNDRLHR